MVDNTVESWSASDKGIAYRATESVPESIYAGRTENVDDGGKTSPDIKSTNEGVVAKECDEKGQRPRRRKYTRIRGAKFLTAATHS